MKKTVLLLLFSICLVGLVKAATVTFNKVYPGTGTAYTLNSNSISFTTSITGSSFRFTSANPADITFNGNNVAGQFTYTSGGQLYSVNGVISRKVGNSTNYSAFYFVESTVLGGDIVTGKAWLFIVPGYESTYSDNSSASTNSAPVNTSLNAFLSTQSSNNPPVITSNGGGLNAYVSIPENTTAVTTVTSTDADAGDTKTYSITGGVDASKFTINSSTGALSLISGQDFENPTDAGLNNVYDVQVTVVDSQGATDIQDIAVTITNVNDAVPVIISNGGGTTASVQVTAGNTSVTTVVATDADQGDVLTYSISGGTNSALFNIDPSSGVLTFKAAATNGSYQVIVKATDAVGNNDTQTLTVNVTTTDTSAPSLVITSSDSNLSSGESATISFKFSELVQNFTYSDVVVAGGTLGSITQSESDPTLYTATFTQSGSGTAPSFNVGANTYQDLAGNNGSAASLVLAYDVVPPTVAVSFASADISYGESDIVTFTFSENPGSSFSLSDLTVTNGVVTNLIQTANPLVWNASLKATSSVASPVVTVNNLSYSDPAGNLGSLGTNTLTLVPPSIDLANTPTSDTGISFTDNITTNRKPVITGAVDSGTATVTVTVQYYVNSVLTTLTYNNVPVTNQQYSLDLSAVSPSTGTMPVDGLPEGYVALNVTTPTSATASSNFLIDLTAPNPAPTANNLTTYDQTPTLTGTATVADGEVLTVTVNGVTYTNGDGYLSLNGTSWTLNVPSVNKINPGSYTITAKVTDQAGNSTTGTGNLTINASTVTIDLANTSASDTGSSSTDNLTSNRKPVITGTASGSDATVKVTVLSGGISYIYNSVAVSGGNWTLDLSSVSPSSILPTGSFPSAGLPTGTVNLTVEGNTSGAIGTNSFVIDYTAPVSPTVNLLTTTDTTPTLTGTATVGGSDIFTVNVNGVTYTNGDGNLSYSSGNWSLTIPTGNELPLDTYTVLATVTDYAGNSAANTTTNQLVVYAISEVQTYNIVADPTFTTANISWTNGSLSSRVVFMKEGTGSITNPVNSNTYSASEDWSVKGTQVGTSGYYCIYNGSDVSGSVLVSNMYPGRTYTIQAFEYDGVAGTENYLTSETGANNPQTVVPWPTTTFTNSTGVTSPEAWNVAARWDHNTVPTTSLHEAVIVYIDGNCEVTNDVSCYNLTIKAAHGGVNPKLIINANQSLNVVGGDLGGQLVNNGNSSALLVKSSSTLPNGTLLFKSGNPSGTVEMYSKASWNLSEVVNSKYKWQFFGIPVKTLSYSSSFNASTCYVREWDETVIDYYDVWSKKNDGTSLTLGAGSTLTSGKGYELVQEAPKTYTFAGVLEHDDFSKSLTYTSGAYYPGQHVLSNPYTAAIDIDQIQFGANTENVIYQYNTGTYNEWLSNSGEAITIDGNNVGHGQYAASTPNTAGNLGVLRQIPSMQGFLIKATNGSTGSISIPYSSLTKNQNTQRVLSENYKVATRITLKSANSFDAMWLFTDENCSRQFDKGWDGRKLISSNNAPQLFSMEDDGYYQINAIDNINNTYIGFRSGDESEFKLIFNHQNVSNAYTSIYLVDLVENKTVDVTATGTEYLFSASPSGSLVKRFKIITLLDGKLNSVESKSLKIFSTQETVFVENSSDLVGDIALYSISGATVQKVSINPMGLTSMQLNNLKPGIYLIKASTNNDEADSKVIIK